MSPAATELPVRRVTAVLDAGGPSGHVLQVAAELAARLHVEVQAVQIEDANLLRLSELGIARMVSLFDAARPLLPGEAAASFARLAADAQAALKSAAQALGLAWSFQVLHGDLAESVGPGELLVIHFPRQALAVDQRFVASIWTATAGRAAGVMLVDRRPVRPAPAVLITERSDAGTRALQVAASLPRADSTHLDVLLAAPAGKADATERWVRELLRAAGRRAHVLPLNDCAVDTVTQAARHARSGILAMPADTPCLIEPGQLAELLDKAECALLLLR